MESFLTNNIRKGKSEERVYLDFIFYFLNDVKYKLINLFLFLKIIFE